MSTRRTTKAAVVVALGSTAALALAAGGAAATAQPGHPAAASTSSLHGWTQLSDHAAHSNSQIGVTRFKDNLQAVWVGKSGEKDTLDTRVVTPGGGTASPDQVLEKWVTVGPFPQVVTYNKGLDLVFAGQRTDDITDEYSGGLAYHLTSTDGKSWTLQEDTFSQGNAADESYGSDVANANNDLVLVYTASSTNAISYHEGYEPISVAEQNPDYTTTPQSGADVLNAGVGFDSATKKTWTVWDSITGNKNVLGVSAQQILPTLGTQVVHAPDTLTKYSGSYSFTGVDQRFDVAERIGGGVYVSYGVGYPSAKQVALWKVGAAKPKLISARGDVHVSDVARGPNGKLWLFWFDAGDPVIHVARTNADATQVGAVCSVPTPKSSTGVYALAGDGSAGPLQLFINSGGSSSSQIYAKTVQPCLSVSVSPRHVAPGGHITVTVTDAGEPVGGADVSFAGASGTTGKDGTVSLHVSAGAGGGPHTVTVRRPPYETAHSQATVIIHH